MACQPGFVGVGVDEKGLDGGGDVEDEALGGLGEELELDRDGDGRAVDVGHLIQEDLGGDLLFEMASMSMSRT